MRADGLAALTAGFIEGCALQVVMDLDHCDVDAYMRTLHTLVADPLALRLASARAGRQASPPAGPDAPRWHGH